VGLAFDSNRDRLYATFPDSHALFSISFPGRSRITVFSSIGRRGVSKLAYDPNADVLYGLWEVGEDELRLIVIDLVSGESREAQPW
jgi:hypothetical protein